MLLSVEVLVQNIDIIINKILYIVVHPHIVLVNVILQFLFIVTMILYQVQHRLVKTYVRH